MYAAAGVCGGPPWGPEVPAGPPQQDEAVPGLESRGVEGMYV